MEGLAEALSKAGLPRDRVVVPTLDQCFDLEHRGGRWIATAATVGAKPPRMTAEKASARRDWHNDYAQTLLELRAGLRNAPDDRRRSRLLEEIRRLIGADTRR
jgi:metallo-beta-lactamase family protein